MLNLLIGYLYALGGLYWVIFGTRKLDVFKSLSDGDLPTRIGLVIGILFWTATWPIWPIHYLVDKFIDWAEDCYERLKKEEEP